MQSDIKHRVAKSLFWMAWSRVGAQSLSFVNTLVVARLLHPSDYGLMAMATVWTSAMSWLVEMGLGVAIIQFRDLDEEDLNTCFWLTMGVAVVAYLALYAAAPALAIWFATPQLTQVLRVLGLTFPLMAIQVVPDSLLRKHVALDKVSQAEIVGVFVTTPVVFSMAWSGAGIWALVAGALLPPLARDIATFWFARWWPGLRLGSKRMREVCNFSLALLGTRVFFILTHQVDALVLGRVAGGMALGFYSMAKELVLLPVTKIAVVVNQLAPSVLSELQTDRTAMRTALLRMLRLVACVTSPVCIGLLLVAEDLVRVLLTDKWIAVVPILRVLALYAMIRALDVFLPTVLLARYRARFLCGYALTLLVGMSLAFWVGATLQGSMGVAAAWVVIYPLIMARMAREALREIDMSWAMLWEQVRVIVGATLMMAGAVLAVQWGLPNATEIGSVIRLACTVSVGSITYGLVMFLKGAPVMQEMLDTVRLVLRPQKAVTAEK